MDTKHTIKLQGMYTEEYPIGQTIVANDNHSFGNKSVSKAEEYVVMEFFPAREGNIYVGDVPSENDNYRIAQQWVINEAEAFGESTENLGFIINEENMRTYFSVKENELECEKMAKQKPELTEYTQETYNLIKQYKDFRGLDFSNSCFKDVKFDTEIVKCNFTNSQFYNCEFTESIQECNFTNCQIDAEFRIGNVEHCNFTNARIEGSAYQEKFLSNDFTEAKVQRFRMLGQSEFSRNELQQTTFDGTFFGEKVLVSENHFLNSVKVELSDLPDSLPDYRQQQLRALNGEKPNYGDKLTSLSNTMAEQRANRYLKEFAEQHKENIANANLSGTKKTVVINAFAGPGAGKTTACHMVVAELKKRGYVAEYVSEYAKDLVWDKNFEMLDGKEHNQFEILKEQLHRMDNKIGKVDFIVTDAPVLLNQIYNQELTDYYKEMLTSINSDYSNFNFFVNRNKEAYEQEGRLQNLAESVEKDQEIKDVLSECEMEYQEFTHETLGNVVDKILEGEEKGLETAEKNRKCYEIDNTWKPGDVVGEEFYKFLAETYDTSGMTENYFQLADEVREENSTTGEFNGENTIRPLNPDTQKPEPVYRTFMEKNGEYIYVGHCFAGDQIEYGEKFGQWKREQLHQKGENGKTQEDVSETERKVKITNHEFDREGYLHFQAEVDSYGLEGLYRVCDPANGPSFTLVSIDYGVLHEEIKEEWNMIEKELRDYTKENFEAYVKTQPDISGMRKAEMLIELKEMDKSVFLPTERNLIMDYVNKIDDIDKTITLINEIAEPKDDGIVRRAADEIEQYDQRIEKEEGEKLAETQKDYSIDEKNETVATNMGRIPIEDYREIVANQYGFDSYSEMYEEGFRIGNGYDKEPEQTNESSKVGERSEKIMEEIKTMEGLDKFAKESGKERITDYLQVGDAVSEDMINHFMNIMPPRSMAYGYLQVGEPYSDALNPQTGKMEATYMTFAVDSETGNYTYRGNCFAGESVEPPKEQEKTLEKAEPLAEESVESNYPPRDMSPTWENIEEQWDYLEKHAAEYTPEAYEEAKMEIEAQEMFLEEQEQVFIESIEDVKVSEKIEEKPIGTVEVKGEVVEFSSENEGLEKYIDASFKLSVSELESLKSFENEQWKITFNEPEKHLLLQYKVEKYFKEAANVEEYTLEDFCKDHEGKIKMRDVVKETGERLTEFGDSALKIKGESENNKIEVERNTEPPRPGITKQEVHDILEILKGAASRHEELRELQEISLYISSMEQQLKEVSQQLDFVKDKLTSIQNKNPEVDKLINDTEILKKHTFSLQEKLQEIKQDFTEMIKNVSESIKQTGQTGLNKLMEHFKIEEKLENFQSGLSKLTADVTEKQIKMERIGYELGQAGAHLQNVDKVVNGKVTLEPSQNAGIALGNNLASPLKKIKEMLNSLNEKTGKVLGKVKKLKTQAAENQKKKEAKKEEKIKQKNQKKEKRKKAIQKRRMMNLER